MKLASKIATLAFGLTAFSAAHASFNLDDMIASGKANPYAGASFSMMDNGFSANAIAAHVGTKLHPNVAAEVRLGIGMGDDNGWELDNYFAVLGKGIYALPNVHENLSVYGLAGLSRTAWSGSWDNGFWSWSASASQVSLALGAGAEFAVTPQISVSAEYLMMGDFGAMTAAASYKF